jgi:hypothetical protein
MRRHGNPSRRTLEKLLTAAGSSLAEFEALRVGGGDRPRPELASGLAEGSRQWTSAPLDPMPLLACALVGEWDRNGRPVEIVEIKPSPPVDRLPRPQSLASDRDAYAITIVGESMAPRFAPGRRIAVSPQASIAVGDDVLVKLRPGRDPSRNCAVLARLVRRSGETVELRRFTPDADFAIPERDIEAIEKIAGELI